ncbi:hypothetical protein E2C01_087411 [Portunus trituberculatus]|uniref:Uncharacterized protein n=1 Tax=Portunus trituberculatus TaxID=210409 RepID=A0A5B7JH80_PORTR|nr:hypothetical protein [Portunus trituberculatus]
MSACVITPEGLTGKKTTRHHFPEDKDQATSLTEERTRVIHRWETDEGVRKVVSGIWCGSDCQLFILPDGRLITCPRLPSHPELRTGAANETSKKQPCAKGHGRLPARTLPCCIKAT